MKEARGPRRRGMLLCILLVGWLGTSAVTAHAAAGPEPLSETETWVAQQVATGGIADLSVHSGSNQIRGEFLESLILNALPQWPVTRSGVRVQNAIVTSHIEVSNAEVLYELELTTCVFQAWVDFAQTQFRRSASFAKSTFDKEAYFYSAIVDYQFDLSEATFNAPVTFSAATVHGGLNLGDSKFKDPSEVDFTTMRVDGHVRLSGASFAAGVNMTTANIGGQLQVDGTMFAKDALLEYIKVGGLASFSESHFEGTLDLYSASLNGDLEIEGTAQRLSSITTLDLRQARVSGEVVVRAVNLDRLVADGLRVTGPTFISNVTVKTYVDLSDATFSPLELTDTKLPQGKYAINIAGMTYQGAKGDLSVLHALIAKAPYDAAAYVQLEAELQRRGEFAAVDRILWEHKDRERWEDLAPAHDWWRFAFSYVSGFLSNYGRNPERSIGFVGILVFLGGLVFRKRYMELAPIDEGEAKELSRVAGKEPYSAFEYSLGLFIPALHLDVERRWKPRARAVVIWRYFHEGLGWVVTAIALASLSGLIPKA